MENWVLVIDLKAYYASFECVERGLDPFTTPLAVTDLERKDATIVLSVSPYLKSLGVPSRCRRRELPKNIPNMIYAKPQMEKYVKKSVEIVSIFLDFVALDDIHIYSIDESFLNIGPYLKLYKCTPKELAKRILDKIKEKTGLTATCGIGQNMFLAKMADDREAKTAKDFIGIWTYDDVPTKLRTIKNLSDVWGISKGYKARLNALGLYSVYDIAHFPKDILIKEFGVMGEELYEHSHGRDESNIREKYTPNNKNLSLGQVLMRDYNYEETQLIIKEMTDDLCVRLRQTKLKVGQVFLAVRYTFNSPTPPFSHQLKLNIPTDLNSELYSALIYIFKTYAHHEPVRQIGISFGSLRYSKVDQLSIFKDVNRIEKERNLYCALDEIQKKYGKNKVLKADSLTKGSTIKERHNQIGGHRK